MQAYETKQSWEEYCEQELVRIIPILDKLGFALDKTQVHIKGERYFISGRKLVLIGWRKSDGKRVAIKVSSNPQAAREIKRERMCREILKKIDFSSHVFFSPEEILFTQQQGFIIFITSFIEQKCTFLERSLEEQFFLALKTLEAQEGIHATTYKHANVIRKTFGMWKSRKYLKMLNAYGIDILSHLPKNKKIKVLLIKAHEFLATHSEIIDLYSGFLVHWDFVPHNIRIDGRDVYFLDHSSMRFGNKYESWARFVNFMTLYNPLLEKALVGYIRENRTQEEFLSLKLMQIFRLIELIRYYANTIPISSDDILILNKKRIEFWSYILETILYNKPVRQEIIEEYKKTRDSLRSEDEKQRQKGLH